MTDIALLSCPFCGWNAEIVSGGPGNHFVQCVGCRATSDDLHMDTAIAAWNRRASPTHRPAVDVVEALREALDFVNEASGTALGVSLSGSDHPNPDGVLVDLSRKGIDLAPRLSAALASLAPQGEASHGANPAQVTDARVEAVARAIVENPPTERQEATKDGWRIIRDYEVTARAALTAATGAGGQAVASIVPDRCTGKALAFDPGVLHVNKDGSGYIAVDEEAWELEDDRCEGVDGPEGSVHWITRIPASDMEALRDFLNGVEFPRAQAVQDTWFTDRALPVKAMSGDAEDNRVLRLHFRRPVTDDDRKSMCDALNLHQASLSQPHPANDRVVEALRECADKLNIARLDSKDETFRQGAQYALDMADAALASLAPQGGDGGV